MRTLTHEFGDTMYMSKFNIASKGILNFVLKLFINFRTDICTHTHTNYNNTILKKCIEIYRNRSMF